MESVRSNTLRGLQNSPNKQQQQMSPTKTAEDNRGRFRRKTDASKPLGNFRANSEPPNEISMHYIHSQEDLKVNNKELAGTFNKGEE